MNEDGRSAYSYHHSVIALLDLLTVKFIPHAYVPGGETCEFHLLCDIHIFIVRPNNSSPDIVVMP